MFAEVKVDAATASAFSDCSELLPLNFYTFSASVIFVLCSYFPVLNASSVQLLPACSTSDAGKL